MEAGGVRDGVENVERQPADAEDGANPTQELDCPPQAYDVPLSSLVVASNH